MDSRHEQLKSLLQMLIDWLRTYLESSMTALIEERISIIKSATPTEIHEHHALEDLLRMYSADEILEADDNIIELVLEAQGANGIVEHMGAYDFTQNNEVRTALAEEMKQSIDHCLNAYITE